MSNKKQLPSFHEMQYWEATLFNSRLHRMEFQRSLTTKQWIKVFFFFPLLYLILSIHIEILFLSSSVELLNRLCKVRILRFSILKKTPCKIKCLDVSLSLQKNSVPLCYYQDIKLQLQQMLSYNTSARVGVGHSTIDSRSWEAIITGLFSCLHKRVTSSWTVGISSSGTSTPRSPRATMIPSDASTISSNFWRDSKVSIFASTLIDL